MQFLNIHLISMILYSISFTRGTEDKQSNSYVYLIKKETKIDDIKNDSIKIGEGKDIGSEINEYFKSKNGELSSFIEDEKFKSDTLLILVDNKNDNDYNKVNGAISSLKECVIKIKKVETNEAAGEETIDGASINIHCADVSEVNDLKDKFSSFILISKKNDEKMYDDEKFDQLTSIDFKDNSDAIKFTAIFYEDRAVISSGKTKNGGKNATKPSSGDSESEIPSTANTTSSSPPNNMTSNTAGKGNLSNGSEAMSAKQTASVEPVKKNTNSSSEEPESSATSSNGNSTTSETSNANSSNGTAKPPKDEISFWSEWWVYILVAGIILAIAIAGFILFKVFSSK
ncbi:hypothetical protein TCON_2063 [Astathelohania contejeani]|uniref:Uncharacterized protein n=1 Tax=Astathelohania contejeani TaxID=164912 RepID=A0ABQ7HX53_9MICR|nr:hypothetical protein TCON_2063 [Thelohania contejeani]